MTSNTPAQIIMESCENPQYCVFHVNTKICGCTICHFPAPLPGSPETEIGFVEAFLEEWFNIKKPLPRDLRNAGPIGSTLIMGLSEIPGIEDVFLKPYGISVGIGRAFRWEEVEGDIIQLLKQCFREPEDEIVVERA